MNNRRRLITLAVVTAILALTGLLPTLLSHSLLLPHVVETLATGLPGQVTVQSCSLSWWQGLFCEQVRYQPPDGGLRLTMPRARSDKGLLALLLAPHYLGEITLEQPTLILLPPDARGKTSAAAMPMPAGQPQAPASWWERDSLRLTVRDGRIQAEQGAGAQPRLLAQAVELGGELEQGTLRYHLAFHGGELGGQFRAQGFVNLPIAEQPWLPSLLSQTSLDIRELQLAPLLELAADRLPRVPRGQGVLNAGCRLRMAGIDQIEVEGDSSLREVALHGGVLGPDHPRFSQLQFRFQGSRHPAEGWRLTRLELQSEPLHFAARGLLDQQRVDFTGQGEADLAQLAGQLPHLLALHQQTTIHQGHLNLALQAAGPLDAVQLQADCQTDRLHLSQAGHAYIWEKPLQVHAEARVDGQGVELRSLQAQAPFFRADGVRNSDGFALRLSADLDPLFGELQKIFVLDVHARGKLQGEFTSRADKGQTRVESVLAFDDLLLSRGSEVILPDHDLTLRAAWLGRPWPPTALRELRLQLAGWPGELNLEAQDMAPSAEGSAAPPRNCRMHGRLLLERLHGLGRLIPGWQAGLTPTGALRFATTGHWRGAALSFDTLEGTIDDFRLLDGTTQLVRDKRLRLALEQRPLALGKVSLGELVVVDDQEDLPRSEPAHCRLELAPLRLEWRHLLLRGETMMVDVGGAWAGNRGGASESGSFLEVLARGNLALLVPWCRQQGWLGSTVDLAGQGLARLSLRRAAAQEGEAALDLQAKNVVLSRGRTSLLAEPLVALSAQWRLQPGAQEVLTLPQCSLRTSRFLVTGSAQLQRRSVPNLLEVQGQMQPAAALLAPFTGQLVPGAAVTLQGTQGGSLLLSAPLTLPLDIRQLTLAAQIPLTELRLGGLTLRDVTLPLDLNRGTLQLSVAGRVEGGTVNLHPQWQWQEGQEDAPLLTMAPESEVLSRVPLSRALNNGLLAHLPPLGCLVQASGTLDLTLHRFSLSPGGTRQAEFALRVGLSQAKPQAMPVLRQLLDSAGLAGAPLRFKERELRCEGRDGDLHCAPLRLLAGDAEITLNGRLQRDGRLAYQVEIPVGEQLAREAGVVVHGPVAAVAAISGTRAAPVFDRQAFLGSLAAQLAASLSPPVQEAGAPSEMAEGNTGTPLPSPAAPSPL